MSISLNANFELLSAGLYLDARQKFNTIIEMKDFAETSIPDGFITYNKETQMHYVFNSSNTVDATLGKWREYNSGGGSSEKQIKDWLSGSNYLEGDYIYHEGELYRCLATNNNVDFNETNWEQLTYGIDELTKEDVEGLLGLTKEEIEAMTDLILDTEVRIDKTYSSSKIYTGIQQCLEDSKTFTLSELGKFSGVSYKIVTSTSEMTSESIIYLLVNGNTYDMYIVEENGATTKIGDMNIDLSQYYTKTEIDNDFLKKLYADGKYATITAVNGKVDKNKIVTALNNTVTDTQVASALLTKTELDKTNAKLGEKADKSYVDDKVFETITNPTELDANKYIKTGFYSFGDATKRTNLPIQRVGTLLVYYAGYYGIQEYILNENLRRFMRRSVDKGKTWSDWKELATMDKVSRVYTWTLGKLTYATMEDFLIDMVNRGIIINNASNSVVISTLYSYIGAPEITELNGMGFNKNSIAGGCLYIDGVYSTDTSNQGNRLVVRFEGEEGNFVYLDNTGWGTKRHTYRQYATNLTTGVADVPKTTITPVFPNGVIVGSGGATINYIVRNGWCNVDFMFNIKSATALTWNDIATGLPKPANNVNIVLINDGGKTYRPIPIKINSTGSVSLRVPNDISTTDWWVANISYPVA